MYSAGDMIVYGENGVCKIEYIAPLESSGPASEKLYYHLRPLVGSGMFFAPVDTGVFMRSVISREKAEALIDSIPSIEPAVCHDSRFNHVDAYYKEIFRQHTPEALVSIIKGLQIRAKEKKAKSAKADASMKRAKEALYGELSIALGIEYTSVEKYISERIGEAE